MTTQYVHRVSLLGLKIIVCNLPLMSFHLIFKTAIQEACSYETCQNDRFKHTHTHTHNTLSENIIWRALSVLYHSAVYKSNL